MIQPNLQRDCVRANFGRRYRVNVQCLLTQGVSVRAAGRPLLQRIENISKEHNSGMVLTSVRAGEVFSGMPKGWIRIGGT